MEDRDWKPDDIYYENYVHDLQAVNRYSVQDHELLAEDWVQHQQRSGLIVPRYLDGLATEVEKRLHQHYLNILSQAQLATMFIKPSDGKEPIWPLPSQIYHAKTFQTAKKLYMARDKDAMDLGLAAVAYNLRVLTHSHRKADNMPEVRDFINEHATHPVIARAFQAGLNEVVYKTAKYKRSLEESVAASRFASSDTARTAIRAALDRKVLTYAIKDRENGFANAAQIVGEYASTGPAIEAMLGYLAGRASKTDKRSSYGTGYIPRVSKELLENRDRQRRAERDQESKSSRAWRDRMFEQERRDFEEECKERDRRWRESDERSRNFSNFTRQTKDPVHAAVFKSDPDVQKSLFSYARADIERAMDAVARLREEDPAISARDIYLHFHARTQTTEPTESDLTTTKILGLFMNGKFDKAAKLPF